MVHQVPNYIVTIKNPRGTSRTRFAPKYEVPLLEVIFRGTAAGGKNPEIECRAMPKPGTKGATDAETGRDRFAGMRVTRVASLQAEKRRLRAFYAEDEAKELHIFDHVYPVDTFESRARLMYPEIFGANSDTLEVHVVEAEDDEEIEEPTETTSDEDYAEQEVPEEMLNELQQLKFVGPKTAVALIEAGFTSVSEIAQTDPLDIETVKGVSAKEAKAIVDHAVDLDEGSETIDDLME